MDVLPAATAGLANARAYMVDGQLRPNRVTDARLLDAMRTLPRELFVAPAQRSVAYADIEVPGLGERWLMQPMVLARLVQAAAVPPGGSVLVLGAGFAAAVFAAMGARVTVLEPDAELAAAVAAALGQCGQAVRMQSGPLAAGWLAEAPYDCIFIDGAVRSLPPLGAQLCVQPPGRLCSVVATDGSGCVAVMAEAGHVAPGTSRAAGALASRTLFDCAARVLREFDPPAGFQF